MVVACRAAGRFASAVNGESNCAQKSLYDSIAGEFVPPLGESGMFELGVGAASAGVAEPVVVNEIGSLDG